LVFVGIPGAILLREMCSASRRTPTHGCRGTSASAYYAAAALGWLLLLLVPPLLVLLYFLS
jgi:hypothetical protein